MIHTNSDLQGKCGASVTILDLLETIFPWQASFDRRDNNTQDKESKAYANDIMAGSMAKQE